MTTHLSREPLAHVTRYRKLPGNAIVRLLDSLDDDEKLQQRKRAACVHAEIRKLKVGSRKWRAVLANGKQRKSEETLTLFHGRNSKVGIRK